MSLDDLVREAKSAPTPEVGEARWQDIEAKLMERVLAEKMAQRRTDEAGGPDARAWWGVAAALAVAASLAAFVGRSPSSSWDPPSAPAREAAGTLTSGEARVDGARVAEGYVLRAGDTIDVGQTRALFDRPSKVTWSLEGEPGFGGRALVKHVGSALVLELDHGAIEAEVVPVASGEAFAVDVSAEGAVARVAVHGTHLRVTRDASKVIVDLSEGVVSIGPASRFGSTYGTLVTAPAHIEFDAADLVAGRGGVVVDHAPASVRTPLTFASKAPALSPERAEVAHLEDEPEPRPPPQSAKTPAHPTPRPPSDGVDHVDPRPTETITEAVRSCAALVPRGDVKITVTSSLALHVGADGRVQSAVFEPPLAPEVQSCATALIYKTRFGRAPSSADVTIPLELSR